ncbi:MAG: TonB family protein [Nitrospiraceae bacterium]|nr:TonB family protein [Nitrospiraceae bacterium]
MKGPSLQRSAALSAGLHITFFLLTFLVLRQSHDIVMPSPYVVNLVSPGRTAPRTNAAPPAESVSAPETTAGPAVTEKKETKTRVDEKTAQKEIEDSIAAIKAKEKIKKKQNEFDKIKRELAAIRAGSGKAGTQSRQHAAAAGPTQGSGQGSYVDRVAGEIHDEWQWPDYMKKDLEAVISIRIQRDGTISQMKFEKKSGDRLFDRSVAQAIAKASPVTPPPYEMEIGVRFYP